MVARSAGTQSARTASSMTGRWTDGCCADPRRCARRRSGVGPVAVDGSVRSSPINRRTEVSVSSPAASMSAKARSADESGSAPFVNRLAWASTTMPVTWWPTMSCSSRARSRRSLWRAARCSCAARCRGGGCTPRPRTAAPSSTNIDIAMIARIGGSVGAERDRFGGDDDERDDRPPRASVRAGQHGGEQHRHHDELGEDPDRAGRRSRPRTSAAATTATAAVANDEHAALGHAAQATPSAAIGDDHQRATAGSTREGSTQRSPITQRSTMTRPRRPRTTNATAQQGTQRVGDASEIHADDDNDRGRRRPRPIGRCAPADNRLVGRWRHEARHHDHAGHGHLFSIFVMLGAVAGVLGMACSSSAPSAPQLDSDRRRAA